MNHAATEPAFDWGKLMLPLQISEWLLFLSVIGFGIHFVVRRLENRSRQTHNRGRLLKLWSKIPRWLVIVFSALILFVAGWAGSNGLSYYKAKDLDRPVRVFDELNFPIVPGCKANLKFHWNAGQLNYILKLEPYQGGLRHERERAGGSSAKFVMTFCDKDGFQVWQKPVLISGMTGLVDDDNHIEGLSESGSEYMPVATYDRISDWSCAWAGFE